MKSTQCISRQSHEACKKVEIYFRQLTGVVDELLLSFKLTTCRDKTRQNFAARLKALFDECAKFYFEILLLQSIKENYFVSSERCFIVVGLSYVFNFRPPTLSGNFASNLAI